MGRLLRVAGVGIGATLVVAIGVGPAAFADSSVSVATAGELSAAVATAVAGETTTITLATGFEPVASTTALAVPAGARVVLTGASATVPVEIVTAAALTGKQFTVTGGAGSTLTLRNLAFSGANTVLPSGERQGDAAGGGITVSGVDLTVTNTRFAGIARGTALNVSGGVRSLTVTDSSFLGNSAGSGAAISLNSDTGPVKIASSTFLHNDGTAAGYPGGAIDSKDGKQPVTITTSVFRHNTSVQRGGAIALDYYGGEFTVSRSIFDSNSITAAGEGKSTSDGGAIAVLSRLNIPATTRIESSTFTDNVAQDEGGAILLQTGPTSAATILNSTFVGNVARGTQTSFDDLSAGGAIEFFGTPATLVNNTFANNVAERGKLLFGTSQRGAAISGYGSGTDWPAQTLTLSHNIFVNNNALRADGSPDLTNKWAQVYAARGIVIPGDTDAVTALPEDPDQPIEDAVRGDAESNVGVDAGVLLDRERVNAETVFGVPEARIAPNRSPVRAGSPSWKETETPGFATPGTIAILPRDGDLVGGLADDIWASNPLVSTDARGFAADAPLSDAGALQSVWVRFDANGGSWPGIDAHAFDGEIYVAEEPGGTTQIWHVAPIGITVSFAAEPTPAEGSNRVFDGWNSQPDGSGMAYPAGDPGIESVAGNTVLYAQWVPVETSPTPSASPSEEPTPSASPSGGTTPTAEPTPSVSPSCPWASGTPTPSPSPTSPSPTSSSTSSPTSSSSPSASPSSSASPSGTPAPTMGVPTPTAGETVRPTSGPCAELPGTGSTANTGALGIALLIMLLGSVGVYVRRTRS